MTVARAGYPTHWISGFGVRAGRPLPLGATEVPGGINFAVCSSRATAMTLVLFQRGEREPLATLPFPESFRVGGVYAMTVFGVTPGSIEYGYRADGPFQPGDGDRFDPSALLVDPYAKLLGGAEVWGERDGPKWPTPWRSRLVDDDFDWAGDRRPALPPERLVIYEAHVRGFTRHPSSKVTSPGTFDGLVDKIPYLRRLGVNCVELMPVFEFDELENARFDEDSGQWRYNYWGYSTVGFFAPKASYAAGRHASPVHELKNLIKRLHQAGIEVILDVVFNHTAEGDERGPTISFRGLDNRTYYMLTPDGDYHNFSGTGNTVNCNDPVVRRFVVDCLRYWATEFHVDGFRFDLAAIMVRDADGTPLADPPLVGALASDPVLRDCKLIAEAWDAAGLYLVGGFPSYGRWSEWNGRYRDTLRRFIKGDPGVAGDMATRFVGSPDLYGERGPTASVNFVTAHDGFTLADLVSYNEKHNESNGEGGRDGENVNNSWHCGHEGETDDEEIIALRRRQMRNALLILLTSQGIPMLLAGDEVGRTQHGNNNAYCHDGPLSWLDWSLVDQNADLFEFTRRAIAFRHAHPVLRMPAYPAETAVSWHGARQGSPDWSAESRFFAVLLHQRTNLWHDCVYVAANARWEGHELDLPAPPDGLAWHLFADTSAPAPHDAHEPGSEPLLTDQSRRWIGARSVVVLAARKTSDQGSDKP